MNIKEIIAGASVVGFSGSRSPAPGAFDVVAGFVAAVAPGAVVAVGCQRGVDALVRAACPSAQVFSASSFGVGRGSFAARSVACVRAVAVAGSSGLWVSLPAAACPPGLLPSPSSSRCFCGSGSGSWASLAFAVGLGVPCLVWLPAGVSPPAGWGFSSLGFGCFFVPAPAAAPVQLSFF